jgi:integrase
MHVIFECAARWELFNERRNPIEMVRVKDSTKRRKRPMILTNDTFDAVLVGLPEPFRTMVVVAQCLGLRVSEITGLQWGDLDTERRQLLVQRRIVNGRVDNVKTEYSHGSRADSRVLARGPARLERAVSGDGGGMDVPEAVVEQAILLN